VTSVACVIGAICWLLIDPNAEIHGKGPAAPVGETAAL